ncbi:hypothetical protein Kpol_1018p34 [Vanderwaltozyma polyspora DSM 70294]|uniref:N-alpha-acetyltransferase 40 n=1 Tax=Vanderwaltozyma polyspora (strain ATCC 22028 / DSM 70294 / BCRC 21397 / CBS 2163 / NBRC 10782 / NRRL Y-8283 / UCD 57-17) TaxID=436907 RepID=A7TDN5_VANPO|nr:uncharacterized protein Kpol_1018p34 [Vanderwaltozyma polyspora DSM 70294]EDO19505.1 hypothetical protein Kpol_1018p34 [Vanderwaltozyma polyspora DSM 70294]
MSELLHLVDVAENIFPETLELLNDNSSTSNQKKVLHRQLIAIDSKNNQIDVRNNVLSYYKDNVKCDVVLNKLLDILDNNLGPIYLEKSSKIYCNEKPWKENKIVEMKSEGLLYVIYNDDITKEPLLFMSFMITDDPSLVVPTDNDSNELSNSTAAVIYLYEIQLLELIRNQKLGTILITNYLKKTIEILNKDYQKNIIALELTVFSNNINAINFYKKIGMLYTPDSPRDKIILPQKRRTRSTTIALESKNNEPSSRLTTSKPIKKIIKKPDYYLLFLPIPESNKIQLNCQCK